MRPMNTAPRDGTMIKLLVEFAEHSLEDDNSKPIWTIGANGYDNDGRDVWQFVGWNWSHDCFTDGVGIPVGWLPMTDDSKSWSVLYEELRAAIDGGSETMTHEEALAEIKAMKSDSPPIDIVLYCPNCGKQHIDVSEAGPNRRDGLPGPAYMLWDNPPHRSHLCGGCGAIWRPADVATNGVVAIKTKGKADSWPVTDEDVPVQPMKG